MSPSLASRLCTLLDSEGYPATYVADGSLARILTSAPRAVVLSLLAVIGGAL